MKVIYNFAAAAAAAKLLQLCPTLCDPIDGSPRGSPIPGVLQARTLEWVAISFKTTNFESCFEAGTCRTGPSGHYGLSQPTKTFISM